MKGPTRKQSEILSFIWEYSDRMGYPPSLREIGEKFSVSPSAVHSALKAMEKKGLIYRNGGARSIAPGEKTEEERRNLPIPFFPEEPENDEESKEFLFVPISSYSPSAFAFRVTSWSMKEGGILPGDIAIAEKEREPKDGDIVLSKAREGEGRMELRRLRIRGSLMELWPENDSMGITRSQNLDICGILTEIRRKY